MEEDAGVEEEVGVELAGVLGGAVGWEEETGLELLDTELLEELTGDEESGWFSSSSGRWGHASTSVEADASSSALALSSDAAGSEEESGTVDAA